MSYQRIHELGLIFDTFSVLRAVEKHGPADIERGIGPADVNTEDEDTEVPSGYFYIHIPSKGLFMMDSDPIRLYHELAYNLWFS